MHVGILMWRGTRYYDVAAAMEVFSLAFEYQQIRRRAPAVLVDCTGVADCEPCSPTDGIVVVPMDGSPQTSPGSQMDLEAACHLCDILIIPGFSGFSPDDVPLANVTQRDCLESAHRRGAAIVSLCTGAFWLASTGLLDGRIATTHWQYTRRLAEFRTAVTVRDNVLFTEQDDIWTSAGEGASTDACTELVRKRIGSAAAEYIIRVMVIAAARSGEQTQVASKAAKVGTSIDIMETLRNAVSRNPECRWRTCDLAQALGMSVRTVERLFRAQGCSPHQWVVRERLRVACLLLETTNLSVEAIAHRAGFSSADIMRRHLSTVCHATPKEYRQSHAG